MDPAPSWKQTGTRYAADVPLTRGVVSFFAPQPQYPCNLASANEGYFDFDLDSCESPTEDGFTSPLSFTDSSSPDSFYTYPAPFTYPSSPFTPARAYVGAASPLSSLSSNEDSPLFPLAPPSPSYEFLSVHNQHMDLTHLDKVTRVPLPGPTPHGAATPVTCFTFDSGQELLWAGNEYGRVSSFYGQDLQKYTSYRVHERSHVKQIVPTDKGILSVGTHSVHFSSRRGTTLWHLRNEEFRDLRCLVPMSKSGDEILVAGCQPTMFVINVEKGEITQTLPAPEHYTILKRGGQYICAATTGGSVQLLNPKTLEVIKSWKAHMGWVNDMDANSNYLVTCGYSPRQQFGNVPDPLAKVFDLKTLMPLPPVPFHAGASFVRIHPRMLTTSIIASKNGQVQVVDIMNSTMVNVRQLNLMDSYVTSLEVAPSGEAMAISDSSCCMQLWGSPQRMQFTYYSAPTEFADHVAVNKTTIDWNGTTPLNSIGMPYYRETLLSAWPSHIISEVGAPPAKIDSQILSSLQRGEIGGFAPNPRKTKPNQAADTRLLRATNSAMEGPKFLSEQANDGENGRASMNDVLETLSVLGTDDNAKIDVPIIYRNVEIRYSRFGVDDFDFEFYNKTKYSGLETHIANSYANPLLQLLRFTPWLRNLALIHTATPCLSETCLLCELGFLIDMLEKANGQNCQATNLLKTFGALPQASSLGLLEDGSPARPLSLMIQAATRFVLEKTAADYRQRLISPQDSHMDKVLTTAAISSIRCAHCANETMRPGGTYAHELVYPARQGRSQMRAQPQPTFSQVLKASVERTDQTRGWCDRCKRYQQLTARKTIQSIPPVLMINAAVHSPEAKQLWAKPGWLPKEIGVIVENGQFFCYQGEDLKLHLQRGAFHTTVYELIGVIADINSEHNAKSHLVSLVNVSPSMREETDQDHWHLFNDFLVRRVAESDALKFDPTWKTPAVLTYQVKSARHQMDDTWKQNLDASILYRKPSAGINADPSTFQTLDPDTERPTPGTAVGIDAEFVMLQQEELEVKADGTRAVVRPSRLGLGRISVLRGGSPTLPLAESQTTPLHLVPFIDDYISTTSPILDHLTEYSGINPGDLDPTTSPYTSTGRLVSLKQAYKKIWILLNLGCIFVGHGLSKDFRTINIQVPKEQVVDTVDLFFDRRRGRSGRKLSLRFLSWYLLGEMIQVEAPPAGSANADDTTTMQQGHDSVVDAQMAVRLWEVWRALEAQGVAERRVDEIYRRGRELGFKVPYQAGGGGSSVGGEGSLSGSPSKR